MQIFNLIVAIREKKGFKNIVFFLTNSLLFNYVSDFVINKKSQRIDNYLLENYFYQMKINSQAVLIILKTYSMEKDPKQLKTFYVNLSEYLIDCIKMNPLVVQKYIDLISNSQACEILDRFWLSRREQAKMGATVSNQTQVNQATHSAISTNRSR